MNLVRREFFFFLIIFIVFIHMSHASKEVSPINIPVIHHKLFDPLDTHLKLQGIELKIEFVNLTRGFLHSYYKKLYRLKEIIEMSRKQSDDNINPLNFDEENFISQYDDSKDKKNTLKYIKSCHSYCPKKLNEYKGDHNLLSFSESFEDWRLSYLNYVTNEPAEAGSLYFLPSVNSRTLSEPRTNKSHKELTNNNLQRNLLSKINPGNLGRFFPIIRPERTNNFSNDRHRLRKVIETKRTGKTNENNFFYKNNTCYCCINTA